MSDKLSANANLIVQSFLQLLLMLIVLFNIKGILHPKTKRLVFHSAPCRSKAVKLC